MALKYFKKQNKRFPWHILNEETGIYPVNKFNSTWIYAKSLCNSFKLAIDFGDGHGQTYDQRPEDDPPEEVMVCRNCLKKKE